MLSGIKIACSWFIEESEEQMLGSVEIDIDPDDESILNLQTPYSNVELEINDLRLALKRLEVRE